MTVDVKTFWNVNSFGLPVLSLIQARYSHFLLVVNQKFQPRIKPILPICQVDNAVCVRSDLTLPNNLQDKYD